MAYDNLKIEKELYTSGKSFTQALESLDPSENYAGTSLEGLDAYQRQLKRFDIKVSGADSDTVSKFFQTSDSSALFPEYVARAVRQGLNDSDIVSQMVAATTNIDSLDYRAVESIVDEDVVPDEHIMEGTFIPETTVKLKDTLTPLNKRGRMLVASYEAVKFQKLDLFTVILKQIGDYIARCQTYDAISTIYKFKSEDIHNLTNGLTYDAMVDFWNLFDPYNLTTIITDAATMAELLKLDEFKDAVAGQNFHGTGSMITPFGANLIKAKCLAGSNTIIGLDKNYAIEKVQAGDVITDFDKLIDRQLERATVSCIAGFSPIFEGASQIAAYE
ncbi:MAG: phage major capsid protein [Ruminococcaceae bacterium]|nr:phage major capsid protein [Oscillospiraceae bacterium]